MELSVAHQLERWEKSSLMMKIRVIRIGLNYILGILLLKIWHQKLFMVNMV